MTEGETFEEAEQNAREAISLYLESLQHRGLPLPSKTGNVVATRYSLVPRTIAPWLFPGTTAATAARVLGRQL